MSRLPLTAAFSACIIFVACLTSDAQPTVAVAFYSGRSLYVAMRTVDEQPCPELAARLLLEGPTAEELASGVTSAIPKTASLISASVDAEDKVRLDVTRGYLDSGADDAQIEAMGEQWFATFRQFPFISGVIITVEGRPLVDFLQFAIVTERAPGVTAQLPAPNALAGRRVSVSPGHGRFWNGSGWYYQRPQSCGYEEEDLRDLKLGIYLKKYLENHGAIVKMTRETDLARGSSPYEGGRAWWQMGSCYWLKDQGYPLSVYASSSGDPYLGAGGSDSNDDVRSRPLMADYENTEAHISIHTNAYSGYCTGACPTGTETYYDGSPEHAPWAAVSQQLAGAVNPGIVNAINAAFPGIGWACHGSCVKDSGGNYAETRIPDRAAVLTELGFHDTCDRDAVYMNDNFFRSVAMWGMYKGVCQYFGDTPSPMYSAEYVSDDIPDTVSQGETRTVHITFRNRGVLWSEARAFRLGAVGDSDPFASTRHSIAGEVDVNGTYTFAFQMAFNTPGDQVTDWRMVRDGFAWFGDTLTRTVHVTKSTDTEPPTTPRNLRVTASTTSSITISWDPSTDNVGVFGYRVYRSGGIIGSTSNTYYTDSSLAPNSAYDYQVEAYDVVPNYSGPSAVRQAMTVSPIFSDGFNGSTTNWISDTGSLAYSTVEDHGALAGPGAALAAPPCTAYHWLDSGASSLTAGGYRSGVLSGWIHDPQGSDMGMCSGLRLYAYDATGATSAIYWVGAYDGSPPDLASHYVGAVWSPAGSWVYYDLGPRSVGWHRFRIEVLPYTGAGDLRFYLDGLPVVVASQPASAAAAPMRQIYIGYDGHASTPHHYDDISFDSTPPAAPSDLTGVGLSADSMRWRFTDNANNEVGNRIYDGAVRMAQRDGIDGDYVDETGLAANTIYTRTARAYAGILESGPSASGAGCTLSVPPSLTTVTCSKLAGLWQSANPFQFTAVGGFGAGRVSYYRYVWDQQPAHVWTGSEATWMTVTRNCNATTSASPWYYHVQGFNQNGEPNGTYDLGPYYFDNTAPSQPVVTDDGAVTAITSALHAVWSASDAESGIEEYQYAIGTAAGGTDVVDWTTPTPANSTGVTRSGLLLVDGGTYYFSVKVRNCSQLWSSVGTSDGITVRVPDYSIAQAKALADGADVKIVGRIVSGAFLGSFYIQEADRSGGIKVVYDTALQPGDIITVTGRIMSDGAERHIVAAGVVKL